MISFRNVINKVECGLLLTHVDLFLISKSHFGSFIHPNKKT